MSNIKLIGIDLDGTALDSQKRISRENAEIFAECKRRGIYVVPVTGRPYSGLFNEYKKTIGCKYSINTNGAAAVDVETDKRIISHTISTGKALEIMNTLKPHKCYYGIFYKGYGYLEREQYFKELDKYAGTPLHKYVQTTRRAVESHQGFIETIDNCDNIYVIARDNSERERIRKSVDKISGIFYSCSAHDDVEIGGECSKGSTLLELAGRLGIKQSEVMAIGDSGNDLKMLELAGVAVAMDNASDDIKNAADFITKSCEESGVAHAINKLVL